MPSRKKRKRYNDRRAAPVKPSLIRTQSGESPASRHERRLGVADQHELDFRQWCELRGLVLRVSNFGEHWQIRRFVERDQREALADWWPRTAKLVILQRWKNGIHCHDWQQVAAALDQEFKLEQVVAVEPESREPLVMDWDA